MCLHALPSRQCGHEHSPTTLGASKTIVTVYVVEPLTVASTPVSSAVFSDTRRPR